MDIFRKGQEGEHALNNWLKTNGLSYLHINQSLETFATLFNGSLKRPDFLVLLESIGMIAVDAKNKTLWDDAYFSLGFEDEFQKALSFERIFRIPLWYAYRWQKPEGEAWYWISALKAMEVGKPKMNSSSQVQFLHLHISEFEEINCGKDIGKLYTHRLQSLKPVMNICNALDGISASSREENQPFRIESVAKVRMEDVYMDINDYHLEHIEHVLFWLEHEVRFPVICRVGDDCLFSTSGEDFDPDILAIIDNLSKKVMLEAGGFCEIITLQGRSCEDEEDFVFDHLIYAVSSVFYDNKNGSAYEVRLDNTKLTPVGQRIVDDLRRRKYMSQIGRAGDYMLMVTIA